MRKLEIRDLISIGIFAAVYIVILFAIVAILGFSAVTYFFSAAVAALLLAPIYLLFLARTQAKFAVVIFGLIIHIIALLMMPKEPLIIILPFVCYSLAELFVRLGSGKKFVFNLLSDVSISLLPFSSFGQFWLYPEFWLKRAETYGYEAAYVNAMRLLIRPEVLVAMVSATIVMAIIGSFIAKAMLKKHFKKAGIV